MRFLICGLLGLVSISSGQSQQTFVGTIADSECTHGDHAGMQMGPTDADCVVECVNSHGDSYVLYDGTNVYALSDQQTPKRFAAQKVTVIGTLDVNTRKIQVDSIAAAQ